MSDPAEVLKCKAEKLQRQGRRPEAVAAYRHLLALRPELADCWYNLGWLLKAEGEPEAALDAYSRALAGGVRDPEEVHLNRAVIYSDHLRHDAAAEAELQAALNLNPAYLPALLNLGNLREEKGDRDSAIVCYERILSYASASRDDPPEALACCEALARLAHLRPPSGPDDPLLARLERAARGSAAPDAVTRANLLFALARALDALGRFDDAFPAFEQANRYARSTGDAYDPRRSERQFEAIVAAFGQAPEHSAVPQARPDAQPVFICGMFRSGSTLVERVLSAHPEVIAGGEMDFFPRLLRGPLSPFPASMATLDSARAMALAEQYRAHVEKLFPQARGAGCITDKRPDNFLLVGLIKRLFPAAKFVHTVRSPLDNCLSIFFQHLDQAAVSYSSDLRDIGHYYGQHRRLMAHWRSLFPGDIFDLRYDAFVREPAPALAELLTFLGLEWDDRCLEFHRQPGVVKTASYWQVRRPLYTQASGRWRNYRAHLGPLREALREAGVEEVP
jgi:tetratricopeptide (TPR) repeat protein